MRLDARRGDWNYRVWHCEMCKPLADVVWVDDEAAQYGVLARDIAGAIQIDGSGTGVLLTLVQAKRIAIYLDSKLVLIDPVDDAAEQDKRDEVPRTEDATA